MKITYVKSIKSLKEDASFSIGNDNLDNITWHDDNPTNITKQQILDEQKRLQAIEDIKPEHIAEVAKADLKTSAKAKLIAGEALTEDEANTIVL